MWCSICRQDVPGSIAPGGGQYCCPRCGEGMSSCGKVELPHEPVEETNPTGVGSPPRSDYDEWEMEERLRHLDRIYARSPLSGPLSPSGSQQYRIDSMHGFIRHERPITAPPTEPRLSGLARFGRAVLALGLAVTVCGGSLAAWGHFGARPDLLPMGIPIAAAGQILLLLGLVMQTDSLANTPCPSRKAVRSNRQPMTGDDQFRLDEADDGTGQLTRLSARLEELSRRFEERDQR